MESEIARNEYNRWTFQLRPDGWKRHTARSIDSFDTRQECRVALDVLTLGLEEDLEKPMALSLIHI